MAARKDRFVTERTRERIRAAHLIRRLQKFADGKVELTGAQVRAIEILLKKIVPDLTQTDVTSEITHRYVVEVPPMLSKSEWLKKYQLERPEPPQLELEPVPLLENPKP